MVLWFALGLMTVVAVGLAVAPLVRRAQVAARRRDYDLRVYRAQLAELARERERGLLGEREAEAARLEMERRMLAADAADPEPRERPATRGRHRAIAMALLLGLPVLAGGLYAHLGSPYQPGAPFAGRADERAQVAAREQETLPSVESMVARTRGATGRRSRRSEHVAAARPRLRADRSLRAIGPNVSPGDPAASGHRRAALCVGRGSGHDERRHRGPRGACRIRPGARARRCRCAGPLLWRACDAPARRAAKRSRDLDWTDRGRAGRCPLAARPAAADGRACGGPRS